MFASVRYWPPTGLPLARQTGPLFTAVKPPPICDKRSILNQYAGLGQSLFTILWRKRQWAKLNKSRHQPSVILSENLRWACWIQSGLVNESTSLDFDIFPLDTPLGLPASHAAAPMGSAAAVMAGVSTPVLHEADWMVWDVTNNTNTTIHIAGLIGVWYVSTWHRSISRAVGILTSIGNK